MCNGCYTVFLILLIYLLSYRRLSHCVNSAVCLLGKPNNYMDTHRVLMVFKWNKIVIFRRRYFPLNNVFVISWSGKNCIENYLRVWFFVRAVLLCQRSRPLNCQVRCVAVTYGQPTSQTELSVTVDVAEMHVGFGIGIDIQLLQIRPEITYIFEFCHTVGPLRMSWLNFIESSINNFFITSVKFRSVWLKYFCYNLYTSTDKQFYFCIDLIYFISVLLCVDLYLSCYLSWMRLYYWHF